MNSVNNKRKKQTGSDASASSACSVRLRGVSEMGKETGRKRFLETERSPTKVKADVAQVAVAAVS